MMLVSVATSRQKKMETTDLQNAPLIQVPKTHHLFKETSKGSLFFVFNRLLTRRIEN